MPGADRDAVELTPPTREVIGTIAVAGGSGTLGRAVVAQLRSRGHEVRALSRRSPDFPVDLRTGAGLGEALAGCAVVIDATNDPSPRTAGQTMVEGTRRLLEAERVVGVGHHVCVSIVGCDAVPIAYYRTKVAQERAVEGGPVPWTIVRATQFHELVAGVLAAAARWRLLPLPRGRLQPVAAADVAAAIADLVEAGPRGTRVEVAGPEVLQLWELAQVWRRATGRRAWLVRVPLPGTAARALAAGELTSARPDVRTVTTFADWLAAGDAGRARNG